MSTYTVVAGATIMKGTLGNMDKALRYINERYRQFDRPGRKFTQQEFESLAKSNPDPEAHISQTLIGRILKGTRPLGELNRLRRETLRQVLRITKEEWQENVGLDLPYQTNVSENPHILSKSVSIPFQESQKLGGVLMPVSIVAFSSSSISVLNATPRAPEYVVRPEFITSDLSLAEYRGETAYGPENEIILQDGYAMHVHTNDIEVRAGEFYVFILAGAPLVMKAREVLGTLCFISELEQYRASEVGVIGRVVWAQPPLIKVGGSS
jgi:hypothetical protein